MIDFSIIVDEQLRNLVMSSPAIAAMDDATKENTITRIADADSAGQAEIMRILQQEHADVDALDKQEYDELQGQINEMNDLMDQLGNLEKDYDRALRGYAETKNNEVEQKVQEELLKKLDTL